MAYDYLTPARAAMVGGGIDIGRTCADGEPPGGCTRQWKSVPIDDDHRARVRRDRRCDGGRV